jgi:hypothetical protein
MNNGFVLDISSIEGQNVPQALWFTAIESGQASRSTLSIDFAAGTSTTVFVPFDSFVPRGANLPEFLEVSQLFFRFVSFDQFEEGWKIEIDKLRVGNVPEPTARTLLLAWGMTATWFFLIRVDGNRKREVSWPAIGSQKVQFAHLIVRHDAR